MPVVKNILKHINTSLLILLPTSFSYANGEPISCPDEQAFHLLKIAYQGRSYLKTENDPINVYKYVVENATRPMDTRALRSACFSLAYYLSHKDQASDETGEQDPVLRLCNKRAIKRNSWLPVSRKSPIITPEILHQKIVGWVDIEITIDETGAVEEAKVIESSNPLLNQAAIDTANGFIYKPHYINGEPARLENITATINTDYLDLAQAKGCKWNWNTLYNGDDFESFLRDDAPDPVYKNFFEFQEYHRKYSK